MREGAAPGVPPLVCRPWCAAPGVPPLAAGCLAALRGASHLEVHDDGQRPAALEKVVVIVGQAEADRRHRLERKGESLAEIEGRPRVAGRVGPALVGAQRVVDAHVEEGEAGRGVTRSQAGSQAGSRPWVACGGPCNAAEKARSGNGVQRAPPAAGRCGRGGSGGGRAAHKTMTLV